MPYKIPPVKGCTPQQEAFIRLELEHLESNPGDPEGNTTRAVYRDGRKSRWFSHCWDSLNWEHIKPRDEIAKAGCDHNEMIPNDEHGYAWKCAKCGHVYGKD